MPCLHLHLSTLGLTKAKHHVRLGASFNCRLKAVPFQGYSGFVPAHLHALFATAFTPDQRRAD